MDAERADPAYQFAPLYVLRIIPSDSAFCSSLLKNEGAHLLVVAPLSANGLAKIVNGMADDLLTSVIRAWDTTGLIDGGEETKDQGQTPKRILVTPAMNTAMYAHPVTARQIRVLEEEWGVDAKTERKIGDDVVTQGWFEVLHPTAKKTLACGDIGSGAMREWTEIVAIIEQRLGLSG